MKVFFNQFCHDVDAQTEFYAQLLGLPEVPERRSPIYRALDAGDSELGFNSESAYELLDLADRKPPEAEAPAVTGYATFMLATPADVDAAVGRAVALGGSVLKQPYQTYYGEWQAVLLDPEKRVFRVSAVSAP